MTEPAAMTYESLVADIQTYVERNDEPFLSQIPRFIMLAENRIASSEKPFGLVKTVEGTLNGPVLEKPVRWRKTKNFSLMVNGEQKFLFKRGYEYCRMYWPDRSKLDIPIYYADYDYEHFFIAPGPISNYPFELQYYERPAPLSSTNQTNWLTQYAPQTLLYGSLLAAQPFLKLPERIAEFQGFYNDAMASITGEDSKSIVDSSAVRAE